MSEILTAKMLMEKAKSICSYSASEEKWTTDPHRLALAFLEMAEKVVLIEHDRYVHAMRNDKPVPTINERDAHFAAIRKEIENAD